MRKPLAVIAAAAATLASPALAQPKPGDRTQSPEQLMREFGLSAEPDDVTEAVAAAAGYPLGSMQNPIRVGGPEGERAYIARLRCDDGSTPQIGQRRAAGVGAFGSITGLYPLDCGPAAPGRAELVLDMYHAEHREDRAPAGFRIEPR